MPATMGERLGTPAMVPERVERMGFFARIHGMPRALNPYWSAGEPGVDGVEPPSDESSLAAAWWSGWDRADRLTAAFDSP